MRLLNAVRWISMSREFSEMKTPLMFLAVLCGTTAWAQLPSRNTSLTLDAKSVSSGGTTSVKQGTAVGIPLPSTMTSAPTAETTQSHQSKTRVEVQMRNLGTTPAQARLEWYFVARSMQDGNSGHSGPEYVWDLGKRDVLVAAGSEDKEQLESVGLTETLAQRSTGQATSYQNGQYVTTMGSASVARSGAHPAGWIVRLMDGDQLLRIQASSSDLEAIGRDSTRLTRMVEGKPRAPMPMGSQGRPVQPPFFPPSR
jgi:hypothetical protein